MEILVYGTVQSASLLLMAAGFSLVYGVSRLPNFAHGAIYVATGYVAWVLANRAHLPYPLAALLALAAAAGAGVVIYRLVLRRIRGMEISEVIATWAVGLAILEGLRWAGLRGARPSRMAASRRAASSTATSSSITSMTPRMLSSPSIVGAATSRSPRSSLTRASTCASMSRFTCRRRARADRSS